MKAIFAIIFALCMIPFVMDAYGSNHEFIATYDGKIAPNTAHYRQFIVTDTTYLTIDCYHPNPQHSNPSFVVQLRLWTEHTSYDYLGIHKAPFTFSISPYQSDPWIGIQCFEVIPQTTYKIGGKSVDLWLLISDTDRDGIRDNADICPSHDNRRDVNGDGIPDGCDPTIRDKDGDGVFNEIDVCPGFDDTKDDDGNGVPDGCDSPTYSDGDGVVEIKKPKSSSSCNDCIHPTLGVNSHGKRQVEDGFSYNNNPVDAASFHTEYPLINATVGETNLIEVKIFENRGISNINRVQFGLGVQEVGDPINHAESLILVDFKHYGNGTTTIEEIQITDKENLIENVKATAYPVKCMEVRNTEDCLKVDLEYSYREAPRYNIVMVNPMDNSRNGWNHYFNHGIHVNGESLNEPPTHVLFAKKSNQQKTDLYLHLVRVDKINNLWEDQNGIIYTYNDHGTWQIVTPHAKVQQHPDEPWMAMTRIHSEFDKMIDYEKQRAALTFAQKYKLQ